MSRSAATLAAVQGVGIYDALEETSEAPEYEADGHAIWFALR